MATEKRLIDAIALLKMLDKRTKTAYPNEFYGLMLAHDCIDDAPTVDAVEVVRCKDCRWAREKDHREPTDTPRDLICQCFLHHYIPAPW